MTAQTATQNLSITTDEAWELLGWLGNGNSVPSDVDLYDGGGNDYTGQTFFGFTTDINVGVEQVISGLVDAAAVVFTARQREAGSFITYLATNESAATSLRLVVGINETHSSVQVVVWNVEMA